MFDMIKDTSLWKLSAVILSVSLMLSIISMLMVIMINPDIEAIVTELDSNVSGTVSEAGGLQKVGEYIINNGFVVPLQMLILSLIPIPFIYTLNIITTSVLTGIALGIGYQLSFSYGNVILAGSLPHIFIELLGYAVFAAVLMKLNQSIYRGILNLIRQKQKPRPYIFMTLLNVCIIYIGITLPMIIIAAFTETYISNWIFDMLM